MSFDIASLTARESFWDTAGVWLAVAVAVGVAMESVADFDTLAEWCKLDTLEGSRLRKGIAKVGLSILIVALVGEVVAAMQSHDISEQIIAGLNKEISETQGREQDLIDLTSGLKTQLSEQRTTLDSLGNRSTDFEKAAKEQKDRDDRALALLRSDERNLEKAQHDLNESANKAANAANIANKAAAEMSITLDAEKAMRQKMQEIVTPRQIDDAHFVALINALKPFPETTVEVALTRESDTPDLFTRIMNALTEAKWTVKPWTGGGLGLKSSALPDFPDIGDVTARGVQISFLESDREKFSPPSLALANALLSSGIRPVIQAVPEKMVDGKPDPLWVKAGVMRIVVGTK